MIDLTHRYAGQFTHDAQRGREVQHLAGLFEYEHLPAHLAGFSKQCHDLAEAMLDNLPDSYELVAGLRKLLEAKDCFVRAALAALADHDKAKSSMEAGWYSDWFGVVRRFDPERGWLDANGARVDMTGVWGPFRPAAAPDEAPVSTPAP